MPPLHTALVCIVLLMPGASISNWESSSAPNLQAILRTSTLTMVNVRTAERDRITPTGSCLSICAGARVRPGINGLPITARLGYRAMGANLGMSLSDTGVNVIAVDPLARSFCNGAHPNSGLKGQMIVKTLPPNIQSADSAIGQSLHQVQQQGGLLLLLSPNPTQRSFNHFDRLTPLAIYQPRVFTGGLAWSGSTQTAGLVTGSDIAPTIAAYFHARLEGPVYGECIDPKSARSGDIEKLADLNARWVAQERLLSYRWILALSLAALVLMATFIPIRATNAKLVGALIACSALAFLVRPDSLQHFLFLVFMLGFLVATRGTITPVLIMIAFVVFACVMLSVDCAFDALMLHGAHGASSFLGYSPIEGARYYGIGNEVMGAWLGATALLAGYGLRRTPIIVLLFIAVLITLCLGHPLIGAKAGGFIAALLTILGFWWAQSGRSFKPVIAALAVLGTILAGGIGLWILGHIAPSHVSQAFAMARVQGGGSLLDTILRKIGMNLYLSVHSIWSLLLASCILGTFRLLKGISLRGTSERAMIIGVASATAASLALNDAGVVAAAICSVYLWSAAACVSAQHSDDGAGIILLK